MASTTISRPQASHIRARPTRSTTYPEQSPAASQKAPPSSINYFPHLPPYSHPTAGVLSKLPSSWIPYAQLMRIDRPAGLYAFYFPYLIGIMHAACISPTTPEPFTVLKLAGILLPYNVLLRGAACCWNDTVDQDFDRQVERCRHRPVARGAVSTTQAHLFTLALLAAQYPILAAYFPAACGVHALIADVLFGIYALMKRVTYYPQVVLGFPFAWAVLFCCAALGTDPFSGSALAPTAALFAANILWTITYDTIYAHQDIADDENAGVKSMAVRFKNSTKLLASVLSVGQVGLLALSGVCGGFGPVYYVGTVGGVAAAMAYYIWDVDLKNPASCGAWFHRQFWVVGIAFMCGLVGEYATRFM